MKVNSSANDRILDREQVYIMEGEREINEYGTTLAGVYKNINQI